MSSPTARNAGSPIRHPDDHHRLISPDRFLPMPEGQPDSTAAVDRQSRKAIHETRRRVGFSDRVGSILHDLSINALDPHGALAIERRPLPFGQVLGIFSSSRSAPRRRPRPSARVDRQARPDFATTACSPRTPQRLSVPSVSQHPARSRHSYRIDRCHRRHGSSPGDSMTRAGDQALPLSLTTPAFAPGSAAAQGNVGLAVDRYLPGHQTLRPERSRARGRCRPLSSWLAWLHRSIFRRQDHNVAAR